MSEGVCFFKTGIEDFVNDAVLIARIHLYTIAAIYLIAKPKKMK